MELIVDANVLLSSLLKDAITRELLLDSRLTLFAPEHLLLETSRHLKQSSELRRRMKLSNQELQELFLLLTGRIETISKEIYQPFYQEALAMAPHLEDAPYLALALFLKLPIWSNDKGLKGQDRVKIVSTQELIKSLNPY